MVRACRWAAAARIRKWRSAIDQAVDPLQVVDGEDDLATSERGMGRLEEPDRLEWLSGLRSLPQQDPQRGSGPLAGQPPELDADGRQRDVALRL